MRPRRMLALVQGTTIPSSRFRVGQLVPAWRASGLSVDVRAGYGDLYNEIIKTPLSVPYKLACRIRRVFASLDAGRYDLVFVQRPALPVVALPEQLLASINPRLIFDYDDHIGVGPDGAPSAARQETLEACVALSARAIAGSSFLAALCGAPSHTTVIPTVIDTSIYVPAPRPVGARVVIGWMGTASNFGALRRVLPSLLTLLADAPHVRLRIVSNDSLPELLSHPQVEQLRWSAAQELSQLQSFDVGIMPLEDNLASLGKCGFKMIQYMSVGLPVVVSCVGANIEIFEGSGAGYCVKQYDWLEALNSLISDHSKRAQMGQAGRYHIELNYSIESVKDRYDELFELVGSMS